MKLPVRKFWFYHRQISRLRAEEDRRMLGVLGSAQSSDYYQKLAKQLDEEIGEIYVFEPTVKTMVVTQDDNQMDPEYDRAGVRALFANLGQ